MECPREAVGRGFPTLGGRRRGPGGRLIDGREAFEEREHDGEVGVGGDQVRVDIARLGSDGDVQGLGGIAGGDVGGLAATAAGKGEQADRSEETA